MHIGKIRFSPVGHEKHPHYTHYMGAKGEPLYYNNKKWLIVY
jgi:hypothetical protein